MYFILYVLSSSSSASSTSRSSSTRTKRPTTCASTADSSRASVPGKNTADYMNKILSRITVVGRSVPGDLSICRIMIPASSCSIAGVGNWIDDPALVAGRLGVTFYFGGTSLLIVVGVAMDTVNQVEAQLIMRHYEGFPRAGRVREASRCWGHSV